MKQFLQHISINILIILLMLPASISLANESVPSNIMMFSPQTIEQAKNLLLDSVAIVQLYWKKLPEDKPGELTGEKSIYKNFAENNTSLDLIGFAIDEEKNIIILDPCFELRRLEKLEMTLPKSSKTIEGELTAVLLRAPALLVRPKQPAQAEELKPLPFIQLPSQPSAQETFLAVTALRKLQETFFNLSLIGPGLGPMEKEQLKFYLYAPLNTQALTSGYFQSMVAYPISLAAVLNNNLQVVGVATHSYLDWTETDAIWKGTTLSKEKDLPFSAYSVLLENLKNNYEPFLYKIKIDFRQKPEEESEDVLGAFYRMFGIGRGEKIEDFEGYGLAISEKLLLVPNFLDRNKAAKIKNITITLNEPSKSTDEHQNPVEIEGEFKGVYKDLAAFLISVKGDVSLKNASDRLAFVDIKPYQPYISLHCEKKFGDKYVICNHFRCFDKTKTKQNKYKWNFYGEISRGDFILNQEGKLVGIFVKEREKDEEIKQYQKIRSSRYERYLTDEHEFTPSGDENIIAFANIKEALTAPEKHLDPMIKPLSKEEEKEKVWLGIEYMPMTKELGKNLKVEKFTKDGEIGVLVNLVYKGSPAEKIGLKPDDIILSVRKSDDRYPLELRPPEDEFQEFDLGSVDVPKALEAFGYKMPEKKPWRSQQNYFNGLLYTIGKNTEIELAYYRPVPDKPGSGEILTSTVKIEPAPPDFENARKFKDEDIGLTLKDLTYEVREALHIPEEQKGVVVAKVETGTPASVAGIKTYEVILAMDDKEIKDVEDFKERIKEAEKASKEKVSLRILSLGKSRVVDLNLPRKKQ